MTFHFNLISSIGLIIDILGVILLFIYGLPSKVSEGDYFTDGETEDMQEKRLKKNKHIQKMAHIGLICLILGFLFQLIGTNLQRNCKNEISNITITKANSNAEGQKINKNIFQ